MFYFADILAKLQLNAAKLEQLADEHPDLREAYMAKVADLQKRRSAVAEAGDVEKVLSQLEPLLDRLEDQLKKVDAGESVCQCVCVCVFVCVCVSLCVCVCVCVCVC